MEFHIKKKDADKYDLHLKILDCDCYLRSYKHHSSAMRKIKQITEKIPAQIFSINKESIDIFNLYQSEFDTIEELSDFYVSEVNKLKNKVK